MTVSELISKLQNLPEGAKNAKVFFEWPAYSDDFKPVDGLSYGFDDLDKVNNVFLNSRSSK